MFIVTAQVVKPVNRDDLPSLPNVDSLKNGSLLGVEPKGGATLIGPSGFTTTPGTPAATPPADPKSTTVPASSGAKAVPAVGNAPAAVSPTKDTPNP